MKTFAAVFAALGFLAADISISVTPALAQGPTPPRVEPPFLAVFGSGTALVAPDEATVRLGVTAQAPRARDAQQAVSRTAAAVIDAVKRLGVAADHIETAEIDVTPTYASARPDSAEGPRISGYQATNVVAVRLERLELVGPLIDAGIAAGANRVEGVSFGVRNDAAGRAQALTAAAEEARRKAEVLARALRLQLGELLEAVEQEASPVVPRALEMRAFAAVGGSATPIAPAQISIHAQVVLRYRLAPCSGQGPCGGGGL